MLVLTILFYHTIVYFLFFLCYTENIHNKDNLQSFLSSYFVHNKHHNLIWFVSQLRASLSKYVQLYFLKLGYVVLFNSVGTKLIINQVLNFLENLKILPNHCIIIPLWFLSCRGSQRRAFFMNNCNAKAAASSLEVCFLPLDAQYSFLHSWEPQPSVSWKK